MSSLYSLLVCTANGLPHLQVDASCELEENESLFGLANNEWACIGMAAYVYTMRHKATHLVHPYTYMHTYVHINVHAHTNHSQAAENAYYIVYSHEYNYVYNPYWSIKIRS